MSDLNQWLEATSIKDEKFGMHLVASKNCAADLEPLHFVDENKFKESLLRHVITELTYDIYNEMQKRIGATLVGKWPTIISFNLTVQVGNKDKSLQEYVIRHDPKAKISLL